MSKKFSEVGEFWLVRVRQEEGWVERSVCITGLPVLPGYSYKGILRQPEEGRGYRRDSESEICFGPNFLVHRLQTAMAGKRDVAAAT